MMMGLSRRLRRQTLYKRQEGRCSSEWGCGTNLPLKRLQEAHLKGLGMGASRDSKTEPRNELDNVVLLCPGCHIYQEWIVRQMHAGWKEGTCDWVQPNPYNFQDVFREARKHLLTTGDENVKPNK